MSIFFPYATLFLSFVPLWGAIAFIDIRSIMTSSEHLWTEGISLCCIAIGFIVSLVVFIRQWKKSQQDKKPPKKLVEARENKTFATEFFLSYIFPLFAFDFTLWEQVVLFLIFFLTVAILTTKHNYFSAGLILELLNYRMYECTVCNADGIKSNVTIISQQRLNAMIDFDVDIVSLNGDMWLDRKITT